jgi:hypothetical protein
LVLGGQDPANSEMAEIATWLVVVGEAAWWRRCSHTSQVITCFERSVKKYMYNGFAGLMSARSTEVASSSSGQEAVWSIPEYIAGQRITITITSPARATIHDQRQQ